MGLRRDEWEVCKVASEGKKGIFAVDSLVRNDAVSFPSEMDDVIFRRRLRSSREIVALPVTLTLELNESRRFFISV